jgi:hypothetical protein
MMPQASRVQHQVNAAKHFTLVNEAYFTRMKSFVAMT